MSRRTLQFQSGKIALVVVSLLILACGGGGSDADSTVEPGSGSSSSSSSGASSSTSSGSSSGSSSGIGSSSGSSSSSSSSSSSGGSLPDTCSGSCNAATPISATTTSDGGLGNVTMYSTAASAAGACGYGNTGVTNYAAITSVSADGDGQWQGGRVCGQCAEVTVLTSQGLKTVTVRIMDKCPDANCGIDLGGTAPATVMADGFGRYAGQWRFVSCTGQPGVSDGVPTLVVKEGSNAWWSRVRVHNPPTGVSSIEYREATSSVKGDFPFDTTNVENAYEVPAAVLQSKAAALLITVNYVDGTTATVQLTPAQLGTADARYTLD